jgi:hypothetical protein
VSLAAPAMPGLAQLIERLRAAPLQVRVGASEAIDAARLLAHLAGQTGATDPPLEALRLRLRPVLCKSSGDLPHFDEAFDAWAQEVAAASGQSVGRPPAAGSAQSDAKGAEAASPDRTKPPAEPPDAHTGAGQRSKPGESKPTPAPWWRRPWLLLGGVLGAAALVAVVMLATGWPWQPKPQEQITPLPARTGASAAAAPTPAPAASAPVAAAPAAPVQRDTSPVIRSFTPDWHASETLRWPWLALLLGLPLLGLLPLLGAPAPLPYITRQRGEGNLTLEAWPPHKQRRQLVRDIAPATAGQLQRHVRGEVDQREAYARRPRLDLRRTVNASLARGGLLQLHYRFARLRPAYLVLVHASQDDDLGVLWARRLADLDVRAAIFRFHQADGETQPLCVEVGGLGRRLPFTALPAPWPEQRLILIARAGVLLGRNGKPHDWVRAARLGRWAQRVLFNPDEPRDWPRRQVQALEADTDGGLGLQVLPFEDNALDAWSDWLLRGELPPITLEAPQLYPRLLKENEARFCGDASPADLASDPAQAEKLAQQIVTQLQAYLGQNGFYWLCACAVPPLLEQRLAQLLGEEYFRRCGASEPRVAAYMARNWRLLVRLPWLRAQPQAMPQWLRLALLARLPPAIQDELREVVRGALGRRSAGARPGEGLALAFDAPDAPPLPRGGVVDDPRHALLVGFVRDGLDARELMLRLPGAWQQWLPALRQTRGHRIGLAALRQSWQRLQRADAPTLAAARRWAWAGVLMAASALAALPAIPAASWPDGLRTVLFAKQAQSVAVPGFGEVLALDAAGRRVVVVLPNSDAFVTDIIRGYFLWYVNGHGAPSHARFSADGRLLATSHPFDDNTVKVWDASSGGLLASHSRSLANGESLKPVLPSPGGGRLLMMSSQVENGQAASPQGSDLLTLRDALTGESAGLVPVPEGSVPVTFAWGRSESEVVVIAAGADGRLQHLAVETRSGQTSTYSLPESIVEVLALSPGGQRWLARDSAGRVLLGQMIDGRPDNGTVLFNTPIRSAQFNADGRRLLVKRNDDVVQVLRASEQAAPVGERPSDLPADTVWRDGSAAEAWARWRVPTESLSIAAWVLALLGALAVSWRTTRRAAAQPQAPA